MSKPEFVYTTYIETTAEEVWHALTDGDFTERYWFGHRINSDWKVGSAYRFVRHGKPSIEGKVLRPIRRGGWPIAGIHAPRMRDASAPHASPSTSSRVARS